MKIDISKVNEVINTSIPLARFTGAEIVELERGYVKMTMPFDQNKNHINIMYAGSLFTVGELPGGALFSSCFDTRKYYPIVTEMTIKFINPAKTSVSVEAHISEDEIVRVNEELEKYGKAVYILEQAIKDVTGEVCALTTARYQARTLGQ